MPIHFGTDGWRAVISDTFTFANLRMVAQAIADALIAELRNTSPLLRKTDKAPMVVVGFDTRFLSDRFAIDVARVLAANNLHVLLAQSDCPTPAVSHAVLDHGAVAPGLLGPAPRRLQGVVETPGHGGGEGVDVPSLDVPSLGARGARGEDPGGAAGKAQANEVTAIHGESSSVAALNSAGMWESGAHHGPAPEGRQQALAGS